MERYLERMTKKRWMLEHLGNYGWTFVSSAPKEIHFTVTYYPKASAFDPEVTEGQQILEDFCEYGGWNLVDSNAKLMVFANAEKIRSRFTRSLKRNWNYWKRFPNSAPAFGWFFWPLYSIC